MNPFTFEVGTRVLFGEGQIAHLPEELKRFGTRVLLVYGGGSIRRTGLYDRLRELLAGFEVTELAGVDPNPRIASVRQGVALCRERGIEVILAVGGGSSIDCAKAVAAGVFYDGDPWDLLTGKGRITDALPIAAVLTLAATGSEMDADAVISNPDTREKLFLGAACLRPKIAVCDPTYTFTVPKYQTAAGSADILSHIIESYFNRPKSFLPDRFCEALMKTVIHYAPAAIAAPDDYEARANLMWASSWAINGLTSTGRGNAWSCHPIEHELSAYYDLTHGAGLAILTPAWMRYVLNDDTADDFAEYGVNVWGLPEPDRNGTDAEKRSALYAAANRAIDLTEEWFASLGLPGTLREAGIDGTHFDAMSEHAAKMGLANAYVPLDAGDVKKILLACL